MPPGLDFESKRDAHDRRVAAVVASMRARPAGQVVTVRKTTSAHTVRSVRYKQTAHAIDVSQLTNILSIDTKELLAVVEGQVSMGQLCDAAIPAGVVPAVVPEFRDFTLSGLINGGGIQSSAHRYGLVRNTVLAMDVITGDGTLHKCSRTEKTDLFWSVFDSQGTMGVVVSATVQLIPAKSYVRSTYSHYTDMAACVAALAAAIDKTTYLDGIVFSETSYVLIAAEFCDPPSAAERDAMYHPSDPKREGLEWYYQHVRRVATASKPSLVQAAAASGVDVKTPTTATAAAAAATDVMLTSEYLSRYMRGIWWVAAQNADNLSLLVDTNRGRAFMDETVRQHTAKYGFGERPGWTLHDRERCMVTQDIGCQLSILPTSLKHVFSELKVFPLWLCPIKADPFNLRDTMRKLNGPFNLSATTATSSQELASIERSLNPTRDPLFGIVVDIGIWGEPKVADYRNQSAMRKVQRALGHPSVWGYCYLTRDELREIYDYPFYEFARKKYHASDAFLHMEDKIVFSNASAPELGRPSCWRQRRAWRVGEYGPLAATVFVWLLLVTIAVTLLVVSGRYVVRSLSK